jgi:hypothetical protein
MSATRPISHATMIVFMQIKYSNVQVNKYGFMGINYTTESTVNMPSISVMFTNHNFCLLVLTEQER